MTRCDPISMKWYAPNQNGPTRNLSSLLTNVKKIPRKLASRIDASVQSASSANLVVTDNLIELPDLETIKNKRIENLIFIPVKFLLRWLKSQTSFIDAIFTSKIVKKAEKIFSTSKIEFRATNRGLRVTISNKRIRS